MTMINDSNAGESTPRRGKNGVAVLGATGIVGQVLVDRLAQHPQFDLKLIAASPRSAGKAYHEAIEHFAVANEIPSVVEDMKVEPVDAQLINDRDDISIVFSALPSSVSESVEPELAEGGKIVISKSSAFRMEEDVPLLIPEVNPGHLELIEYQRENRGWDGALIADPNCSTTQLVVALSPINDAVGIRRLAVSTMQAGTGAGFKGESHYMLSNNVLPNIQGEAEKIESEPQKILGSISDDGIEPAPIHVSASTSRVDVDNGHTESIFLETQEECSPEDAISLMEGFGGLPQELDLYSSPNHPVKVTREARSPNPKSHSQLDGGMSVAVGNIRRDNLFEPGSGLKMFIVGNNIVRGAGGMAILNAELITHPDIDEQYNIFSRAPRQKPASD